MRQSNIPEQSFWSLIGTVCRKTSQERECVPFSGICSEGCFEFYNRHTKHRYAQYDIAALEAGGCRLTSSNEYFQLTQKRCRRICDALLVNVLQFTVYILVVSWSINTPKVDFKGESPTQKFTYSIVYMFISLVLARTVYQDWSAGFKAMFCCLYPIAPLRIEFWDCVCLCMEFSMSFLFVLSTWAIIHSIDDVLEILFSFAGLVVVQQLDNLVVQSEQRKFTFIGDTENEEEDEEEREKEETKNSEEYDDEEKGTVRESK
jgi:hypothetical protein